MLPWQYEPFGAIHGGRAPTDGAVLALLAGTTRPLSGREVARLIEGTHNTVRLALKRLSEQGIVTVQEAGSGAALLYRLNREHLAAGAVELLANLRERLFTCLRDSMREWAILPAHAYAFGSVARGDGDTSSDIDLFIVRPAGVGRRTSTGADNSPAWPMTCAAGRATTPASRRCPRRTCDGWHAPATIVGDLQRDAVTLVGVPIRELLGMEARERT